MAQRGSHLFNKLRAIWQRAVDSEAADDALSAAIARRLDDFRQDKEHTP